MPEKPFHGAKIFVIMIQTARDTLNTRLNPIAVFPQQRHAPANVQGLGMMGKAVNCAVHVRAIAKITEDVSSKTLDMIKELQKSSQQSLCDPSSICY